METEIVAKKGMSYCMIVLLSILGLNFLCCFIAIVFLFCKCLG